MYIDPDPDTGGELPAGDQIIPNDDFEITGFNSSVAVENQVLTIDVGGITTTYTVDIEAPELKSIFIDESSIHKTSYYVGDILDISGLKVMGKYIYPADDGEIDFGDFPLEITETDITGFNSDNPVTGQILTITFEEEFTTYTVDILQKPVLKLIEITNPADKLIYEVGESLDLTGLQVTGKYVLLGEDGELPAGEEIILNSKLEIIGFNSTAPVDDQILTISFEDKTTEYLVDIVEKIPVLKLIYISHEAKKLTYEFGEEFDITGLEITGKYVFLSEDGEIPAKEEVIDFADLEITEFDSSVLETGQVLTIKYQNKIVLYTIDIVDTTAPVLTLPENISETTTNSEGKNIDFTVTVDDIVDGFVPVKCDYNSGDFFPLGLTIVTCSATDNSGNKSENNFEINLTYQAPASEGTPTGGGGGGGGFSPTPVTSDTKSGDANNDNLVNELDFSLLMSQWGQTGTGFSADFNNDGVVNELDFSLLMANWGL